VKEDEGVLIRKCERTKEKTEDEGKNNGREKRRNTRKKILQLPIHNGSKKLKCFSNVSIQLGACSYMGNSML